MAYAQGTTVSVGNSWAEIERTLERYGAVSFVRGWDQTRAFLAFVSHKRQVKFFVPMPPKTDYRVTPTTRKPRSEAAMLEAWEQACRQRMRALSLVVKAKLEAVEAGISTFEDEFMANIVLPSGETVGEVMTPQIAYAYETNTMPALLPSGRG